MPFFPPHTETRVQKQLREELLPNAEGYLHQAMSSASAVSYFRVPVPRPALHHSLDDAQRHLSLGGKMVITQDLVAITQVFSRGRSREGGKRGEKPYCLNTAVQQRWPETVSSVPLKVT